MSEANEPSGIPPPLGRAEQRSSVRNPKGTDVARLFFAYFLLASLKKSKSPAGARPGLPPERGLPSATNPSALTRGNHKGCPYALQPSPWATTRVAPTPFSSHHGQPQGLPLGPSALTMGNHKGCPYALQLSPWATTRVAPTPFSPHHGQPQGLPLRPSALTMGNHKGCPYALQLSPWATTRVAPRPRTASLGVTPHGRGKHRQLPLPDFSLFAPFHERSLPFTLVPCACACGSPLRQHRAIRF